MRSANGFVSPSTRIDRPCRRTCANCWIGLRRRMRGHAFNRPPAKVADETGCHSPKSPGSSKRADRADASARRPPSARKQLVADVARGGGQADAAGLAPGRLVDLFLVADLQAPRNLLGHEDRVAHSAAGPAIPGLHFLPKFHRPKLELRQLLADLAAQAAPLAFVVAPAAARKHPEPVVPAPDEKHATLSCRDEL